MLDDGYRHNCHDQYARHRMGSQRIGAQRLGRWPARVIWIGSYF